MNSPQPKDTRNWDSRPWLLWILFASLVPVLWFPQAEWVYEDAFLMKNVFVHEGAFWKMLTTPFWEGVGGVQNAESGYRPFLLFTLWVFKIHPVALHLFLWLAHLASGLSLYFLLSENRRSRSSPWPLIALAIFLFHPFSCEIKSQIMGLSESVLLTVGCLAFYLSALLPAVGLFLIALTPGFKETGMIWLAVYVVFLFVKKRPSHGVVGIGILLFWGFANANANSGWTTAAAPLALVNPLVELNFWDASLSRMALLGHAVGLFLFPWNLSSDYSFTTLPLPSYPLQIWFFVGVVALVLFARNLGSLIRSKWGLVVTAAILSAVLGNEHLFGYFSGVFNERSWLVAYFGVCLWIFSQLEIVEFSKTTAKRVLLALVVFGIVPFWILNFQRQKAWVNSQTLYLTDSIAHPTNAKLHFNYGFTAGAMEQWPQARDAFLRALRLYPNFPEAHFRLSLVYDAMGEKEKGQQHREAGEKLRSANPTAN